MQKNSAVSINRFRDHCASDTPYYCQFHSAGSAMHCHLDFYEFTLIISGSYHHIYKNRQYDCHLGHLLFFKPGEIHSFIENSENSYHYSVIVKQTYFETYCMTHMNDYEQILEYNFTEIDLSGSQFAFLSQLASRFSRCVSHEYFPAADRFLYNALFACFHKLPDISNSNSKNYAMDILRRMDNYEIIHMNITDIYKNYPVSSVTLIQEFKNLTGYTIVQYRNIKRMDYAAYLLTEENYPVSVIADILNITSVSHFAQQFRSVYGVTPKQYQIQHRT